MDELIILVFHKVYKLQHDGLEIFTMLRIQFAELLNIIYSSNGHPGFEGLRQVGY